MFVRTYILTILDSGFLFKQNYGTAVAATFFLVLTVFIWFALPKKVISVEE
ncbi:hypothetical protein [Acinetobacter haemolyticus]|uniref:hypothetical protein n=1 Tax=Acinetobacter haemolyticus TaxID=29430 RepID=UPI0012FD9F1F|nr:hypothetical protein [Acinetobacter haemolyticus]